MGFPTPAEENLLDTITLDSFMIHNRAASFMMRVNGDAMDGAGIRDGDFVIVERGAEARPGEIVIAEVDQSWVMRYLRRDSEGIYLQAAHDDYPVLRHTESFIITAIVRGLVRKYE